MAFSNFPTLVSYSFLVSNTRTSSLLSSNFFNASGDIFLFPSSLAHMVETKQGKNTRISLSFNVFIKGTVGSDRDLTELILD